MLRKSANTYLAIILVILFWASAYVGIRAGLQSYSPGPMALLRYLIASVFMFFIYWRTLNFHRIPWRDILITAVLGIFGFSIYNVTLNYGEITVSAGMSGFIIGQAPVIITLFSATFFGDRLTRVGWIGTLLSMIGIFCIAISNKEGFHVNQGIFYILIATLSGSFFSLLQKPLLKHMHPIECTSLAIWFGTLGLIIYLPQLIHEIPHASLTATIAVIYNGIFPAALAYLLWSYVLAKLPMTKAAVSLYLIPVTATILGFLVLHETATILEMTGGLMTLLGAFLVNRNVYNANDIKAYYKSSPTGQYH